MFFRHSADKLIYPLIAAILIVFVSYRPRYRLRPEMPRAFFSEASSSEGQPFLEQRIAGAYWESAQMDIQWQWPHGHTLPVAPPVEFRITAQGLGPAASDQALRQRYWNRLRQVWNSPDVWRLEYEWNWSWASNPVTSAGEWIRDGIARIFSFQR